jgi:alkylmercury lyase
MEKVEPNLEELAATIVGLFPTLSTEEQRVSVQIYRLLAEGQPVPHEKIANTVGISTDAVEKILGKWPGVYYDDAHRVIGYWGLALPEMDHLFEVDGLTLYTWCAWDSLFIPELIQKTVHVESACPVTGENIRLTVSPEKILEFHPASAVMSFLRPEAAKIQEDVITHFCHFVHSFRSEKEGADWASRKKGTFILTMQEAHTLARRKNTMQYSTVLEAISR